MDRRGGVLDHPDRSRLADSQPSDRTGAGGATGFHGDLAPPPHSQHDPFPRWGSQPQIAGSRFPPFQNSGYSRIPQSSGEGGGGGERGGRDRRGGFTRHNSWGGMFRLKHSQSHKNLMAAPLPKCLTFWQLIPLGVGSTIGAGVYVLIGTVAREKAGPALPLSFLIAGVAAGLAALCYAELASRCPSAGSAYHYAYTTVGEVVAWLIGWALILEYSVGGAAVARGISPNLATALGGADNVPFILARLPIPGTTMVLDPCAALMVALVTALLSAGIKESANFQLGMTVANVIILVFVAVAGAWIGFTHGWPGYKDSPSYLPFGVSGLLGGAAMAFFSYIGFDTVASTAEEVKHPQRDLPLGIGLSLTCCGALYMVLAAVLVGLTPFDRIDPDTPMAQAFQTYNLHWAKYLVTGGALAALSTTLLGSLLPQPRILMVMARDGLLPGWFGRIDKGTGVPLNATAVTGLLAAGMAFVLDIGQLSGMVSVGTLLAFTTVSLSVLILRYTPPSSPPTPLPSSHPPSHPSSYPSSLPSSSHNHPHYPSSSSSRPFPSYPFSPPSKPQYISSSLPTAAAAAAGAGILVSSPLPIGQSSVFAHLGSPDSLGTSPAVEIRSNGQLHSALAHTPNSFQAPLLARLLEEMGEEGREEEVEEEEREEEREEEEEGEEEMGEEGKEGRQEEESALLVAQQQQQQQQQQQKHCTGLGQSFARGDASATSSTTHGLRTGGEGLAHQAAGLTVITPCTVTATSAAIPATAATAPATSHRRLASRAIVAVSLGAPLLAAAAAAASAGLSSTHWLPLLLFALGGALFLGGAATLGFINEDEGRHQFGSAGGFHCPLVPWLPLASILINVYLMANLGATTWLYSSSWLAIGAVIYLVYGIHHSALGRAHAPGPRVLDASKRTASWWNLGTPFEEWVVKQTHRQTQRQADTQARQLREQGI
ncbi:hypothetical protein CLOP_g21837 [Closterium sp. NIES-67]|nr:hypothetical protein CLOP_g21837 [Closterium sp. NIES-67]